MTPRDITQLAAYVSPNSVAWAEHLKAENSPNQFARALRENADRLGKVRGSLPGRVQHRVAGRGSGLLAHRS